MALSDTLSTLSAGYQSVLAGDDFTFGGVTYDMTTLGDLRLIMARYRLAACDDAIDNIMLGSQSYTIEGRSFTKADVDSLRRWRSEIISEIASRSKKRPVVKNVNFSGAGYP
jgi:hypothetical protein